MSCIQTIRSWILVEIPRVVAEAGLAAEIQTTLDRLGLHELKSEPSRRKGSLPVDANHRSATSVMWSWS